MFVIFVMYVMYAHVTHLNAGHTAGHVEVLPSGPPGLHQGDTVTAPDVLGSVLATQNMNTRIIV